MTTAVNLMGLDRSDELGKLFSEYKDVLLKYIGASPDKDESGVAFVLVELNVDDVKLRLPTGTRYDMEGAQIKPGEEGELKPTIVPRYHKITAVAVKGDTFPASLGVTMAQYLEREAKNKDLPDAQKVPHETVLLNDGVTRVIPIRVGTKSYFASRQISSQIAGDMSSLDPLGGGMPSLREASKAQ
jgi:hypothetical protein